MAAPQLFTWVKGPELEERCKLLVNSQIAGHALLYSTQFLRVMFLGYFHFKLIAKVVTCKNINTA
jgi:hypothetical protein